MTLDEAINHCNEVAERLESKNGYAYTDATCEECAKEHRQLAEWLKELMALKENDDVKDVFKNCDTCKYQSLEVDEFPCDRCRHRYINQYVYDDKREVNADENSD
jgi:hypothetical protein